ncbi:M48 family metallopeptidase [Henriciella aquimarina]|uniref:M48 family metallopeptidase n=1 Tax=Henriciella aquimarina TaxID=545261 RepID=UPI000A0084F2|nr:M48 family metallopeptidase [Henriciella aquimarina]
MKRGAIIVVALFGLAVYYFSNQEVNPFSGESEFNTISVDQASQLGEQSYVQILQQARGNVLCLQDNSPCDANAREIVTTVREIGARLQAAAIGYEQDLRDEGWEFTPVADDFAWAYNVIESAQPNAFCLPGGYVAVYTGILDVTGDNNGLVTPADLDDPDKLAVVMGHEIGHALAHHGAKRMSQGQLAQLGMAAVGVGLSDMDPSQRQMVMQAMGVAAQGGLMAFSRKHETEADRIGLELLVRACYDPREAPELWERMGQLGGERPPEWLSTHPASETRAANFREWMPDYLQKYRERCGALPS